MNIKFTESEFSEAMTVYTENRDEFKHWAKEFGAAFIEKWHDDSEACGYINREFAYYMVKQFIDWRKLKNVYLRG